MLFFTPQDLIFLRNNQIGKQQAWKYLLKIRKKLGVNRLHLTIEEYANNENLNPDQVRSMLMNKGKQTQANR
jgi:hypothetical protein